MRAFFAFVLMHAGNFREAVEHFRAAMSLNPFYTNIYRNGLSRSLMFLGEFNEAMILLDEIMEIEPAYLQAWLGRAYIFGQTGRDDDASEAMSEIRRLAPTMRVSHMPWILMINDEAATNSFMEGLSEAGLPE